MRPKPTMDRRRARGIQQSSSAVRAALTASLLLAGCESAPAQESLPRYELPSGWEWMKVDGDTDRLTAVKYLGERPPEYSGCDCPVDAEMVQISGTPAGNDDDARAEITRSYEDGRAACDSEREHNPEVGDCGLVQQELKVGGHSLHVYVGQGMDGPVSLFTFVKSGKVVHGSITGRADEHVTELEVVISTLTWQ